MLPHWWNHQCHQDTIRYDLGALIPSRSRQSCEKRDRKDRWRKKSWKSSCICRDMLCLLVVAFGARRLRRISTFLLHDFWYLEAIWDSNADNTVSWTIVSTCQLFRFPLTASLSPLDWSLAYSLAVFLSTIFWDTLIWYQLEHGPIIIDRLHWRIDYILISKLVLEQEMFLVAAYTLQAWRKQIDLISCNRNDMWLHILFD